jgi:DNA ligase-1
MFPAEQLKNKESNCEYRLRYESNLIQLKNKIESKKIKNIEIVKVLYQGTDQLMIEEYLQHAVDNDWEGIMLNKNTTYKCKRTTDLIKIKRFYTMDLPIADVAEGDGRLKGTLGALIVDFKGNKVNIGSGYSDDQRDYMWENKADLIGRIAEVKYKEISSDKKTGLESLQFPIFVSIRELGKGVSYD